MAMELVTSRMETWTWERLLQCSADGIHDRGAYDRGAYDRGAYDRGAYGRDANGRDAKTLCNAATNDAHASAGEFQLCASSRSAQTQ